MFQVWSITTIQQNSKSAVLNDPVCLFIFFCFVLNKSHTSGLSTFHYLKTRSFKPFLCAASLLFILLPMLSFLMRWDKESENTGNVYWQIFL